MRLRESGEDYLEAILVLQQKSGAVRAIDVAGYLGVTKASVSKAFSALEDKGLIEVVKRDVRLTEEGSRVAHEILERHVFFRDLLIAAGVDADTAAEKTCHMEHCLSEDSFQKLRSHLS